MKRIRKEELPKILTDEIIDVLAEMALEFPQTNEWHQIAKSLDNTQLLKI